MRLTRRLVPRALLASCLLPAATALGLPACSGDGGDPVAPTAPTVSTAPAEMSPAPTGATTAPAPAIAVVFRNGAVEGGAARHTVELGDVVRLRVTSDVADEVHVHGYDRFVAVAAGGTVELELTADIPGQFEVELEERGRRLLTLEVRD